MRYARAVNRGPRIDVPSTQDDELPLRSLVATSFACLALGLTVAYGLTGGDAPTAAAPEPSDLAPSASVEVEQAPPAIEPMAAPPPAPSALPSAPSPEPAPAEPAESAALAPDAASTPETTAALAAPDIASARTAEPQPEPEPEPEAIAPDASPQPARETRRLRIEPGVFAYLRCEGAPKRRGRYPCPRDRELEARMRTIVEALPSCREAHAIPRGRSFDVRIELGAGGAVNDLLVKAPNEAAEHAVRACAGPALRKARTALKSTRMIVSMRFKVR